MHCSVGNMSGLGPFQGDLETLEGRGPALALPSAQHRVRHRTRAWECLLREYMTGEGGLLLALSHGPLDLGEQGVCLFLLGD